MKAEPLAAATRKLRSLAKPKKRGEEKPAKPSFAKALFSGNILSPLVFPYPETPREEQGLIDMTLDAIDKLGRELDVSRIEDEKRLDEATLGKLKAMGLFGLIIPEAYGGSGFSNTAYVQLLSATSVIDTSLTATLGAHQSIGLKAVLLHGSEEQKAAWLPRLATGEWIAAFALTEPGAGSDARSLKTTAELSPDGTHYVLNGSKIWITNGGIADFFTVFARTFHENAEGKRKERITCFAVTRDMDGFSSGPEEKKMGLWGSSTTGLAFENVKVPVGNVIGTPGEGFKIALNVLNNGRLGLAGACATGAQQLIQRALEHALQRKQFGLRLADFGLIQSKFANMLIEAYAAEAMVRVTARLMDKAEADYSLETAMCKVFSTEMEWRLANECLQIAGGTGYMKEYGYEKVVRDSRIFAIWEGANEILRLFVGLTGVQGPGEELKVLSDALKNPLSDVMTSIGAMSDFGRRWLSRRVGTPERVSGVHPQLQREAALLDRYVAAFAAAVETSLLRFGKGILHKELVVKRLADIATDLFALAAVLSRATRELDAGGEAAADAPVMARAFARKARRRMAENLRRMDRNDDEMEIRIANRLYERARPPRPGAFQT